ncbi:hypothetical protein ACMU_06220 [Actibacterium mucosum KCTC 23349]|uniref:C4-dicarboxylate ABC transporter substrate-binding protein n=1 Tax=Actibacterium mucosum KCTC 23349 TaxID=1454373 RepID=A0A037ZKA4_9RHOB|nr:DctP family TRAP transporter solute-binding subunit [Actibacterium mucosum]KAJ56533.1 hypothetical protein ACMU_06220 [Actibacterium mucosum KCTC 23349]
MFDTLSKWAAAAVLTVGATTAVHAADVTVKFASAFASPEIAEYQAIAAFKDFVESRSGGEIEIKLFAQSLGGDREMFEQVQQGSLEMSFPADGAIAGFYPPVQVLSIPYAVPSSTVAWRLFESDFMKGLTDDMREQTGVRTLALSESGFRSMSNNVRTIKTPEDMVGLKMRTMESPVFMELMRSLGSVPTPLPATEIVISLKQGVVDGQENPIPTIANSGIGEVQKFVSADEHVLGVQFVITNDEWWNGLEAKHQQILKDGSILLAQLSQATKQAQMDEAIAKLEGMGTEVYINSLAEKRMFRDVAQPGVRAYIEGLLGTEIVADYLAAVDLATEQVYGN